MTKDDVLATLVPDAALDELAALRDSGVEVTWARTHDAAYDDPRRILDVYRRIQEFGHVYERESGGHGAAAGRLTGAAAKSGVPGLSQAARRIQQRRRARLDDARKRILYDRDDVRGLAWYRQTGRATALVTIVDALALTSPSHVGRFERLSGRLDASLIDLEFGPGSGWLQGLSLEQAVIEAKVRFSGWDRERARTHAESELADLRQFVSAAPTDGFRAIVGHCLDGLGIRSRKENVHQRISEHAAARGDTPLLMLSIGCGTALPMLEVLASLTREGGGGRLILVDQDPVALACGQLLAEQFGLAGAIEIHCVPLIEGPRFAPRVLDLDVVLDGRRVDVCEDSGLREYFPDSLYRDLARQAWEVTAPGGLVTTGNMNHHRPQPQFLHGLMGWPIPVRMRTMAEVHALHVEAGVPSELLRLSLTQEGVYTMCFVTKPGCGRD